MANASHKTTMALRAGIACAALAATMIAMPASAQQLREGWRRSPQERIAAIDRLGSELALNPEQTRLYADLRAAAVKTMGDRHHDRPAGGDPFQQDRGYGRGGPDAFDPEVAEADHAAITAAGSKLFATLDGRQKETLSADWRDTFGPLMHEGGPHGRHHGMGEGDGNGEP